MQLSVAGGSEGPNPGFSPALRQRAARAAAVNTLTSGRDEEHDGKPAHLLLIEVPLPASASKQMTIKHYTGQN